MNGLIKDFKSKMMLVYAFCMSKKSRKAVQNIKESLIYSGAFHSFEKKGKDIYIEYESLKVKISILDKSIIKIAICKKEDTWKEDTPAIYKKEWDDLKFEADDDNNKILIDTGIIKIRVLKEKFNLIFEDKAGIINEDYETGYSVNNFCCYKKLDEIEHFYGFGEKTGPLDKYGWDTVNWNTDVSSKHDDMTKSLYVSIPFFIGIKDKRAYGIYCDNAEKTYFDMGRENKNYYYFGAKAQSLNYYFIYGPKIQKVVEGYTALTGRMKMPPAWILGHQQSRWSYCPDKKVLEIARKYRKKNIPCDVIYLDIDYMDGYRVFTWDKIRFKDFKDMNRKLHEMGFKVVAIIDPGVKADKNYFAYSEGMKNGYFIKTKDGETFVGKVWPMNSVFPDFSREEVRYWWGDLNKKLIDAGVDGIWNDMNEPSLFDTENKTIPEDAVHESDEGILPHRKFHNLYGMMMDKGTYEGLLRARKNKRPFLLSRSGFAGIQRYVAIWTGDNMSLFEHLKLSIPMNCNLGLSGIAFIGNDIGGFNKNCSEELLIRWYEAGTFLPFFRNHSAITARYQEPWAFGESTEKIIKKYIELRYKLLPYIYNLFHEASAYGHPIIRPLVYEFQDDEKTCKIQDEFMVGRSILAAPVVDSGINKRKVYLPSGHWIDFWNGNVYKGGCEIEYDAPVDILPLFIKSGSIIPEIEYENYIGEKDIEKIILNIYPSNYIDFMYYEDDGETFDYEREAFLTTKLEFKRLNDSYKLKREIIHKGYNSLIKYYEINIVNSALPVSIYYTDDSRKSSEVKFKYVNGVLNFIVPEFNEITIIID